MLQQVQAILDGVLKEGFDPKNKDHAAKGSQIKQAMNNVRTVVTMKGHYPA